MLLEKIKGFLGNVVRNMLGYSIADFERDFARHFYGGWKSNTGKVVNEETALKFSAVFACVKIIAEDIGMLPTELRKWRDVRDKSKGSDPATKHPLYEVLMYQPNRDMHSMIFDETLQSHVLLSGNGYAYKHINQRGQVTGLKLLDWYDMDVKRNKSTGLIEYVFNDRGKDETFRQDEIYHIPGLGYDGIVGYSPVRMSMEAIGLGLAAEDFAARFYANGANVGGFLTMPGKVADPEALREEFKALYGGVANSHKTMVLEAGADYKPLNRMPLADAEFILTRRLQIEEVARIYRMPLHMLQDLQKATFSNIEHQDLAYVKRTLLPWIRRTELAIDTRLLTARERAQGYFSRFQIDELLRGDAKTRAEVNHIRRQDGIITTNEWRAMDDMNPRSEPEADKLIVNGNMREISIVGTTEPVEGQQFRGGGG